MFILMDWHVIHSISRCGEKSIKIYTDSDRICGCMEEKANFSIEIAASRDKMDMDN